LPRLGQNPELLRAARLAKVGPETWESWKRAAQVPLDLLKSFMGDSVAGDLLRAGGVEMPPRSSDIQTLENNIIDFGIPQLPVGQIKRLSHAVRKGSQSAAKLREVMVKENRLRGPAQEGDYLDSLLRSTPFHGRGYEHYPDVGEVYSTGFGNPGNLGEPGGLSVTYQEPSQFNRSHHFAKRPRKYNKVADAHRRAYSKLIEPMAEIDRKIIDIDKKAADIRKSTLTKDEKLTELSRIDKQRETLFALRESAYSDYTKKGLAKAENYVTDKINKTPPIARVFPRFHGRPTEKVIKGWKGSGDETVLQDAYKYALQQMPEAWTKGIKPTAALSEESKAIVNDLKKDPEAVKIIQKHLTSGLIDNPKLLKQLPDYASSLDYLYPSELMDVLKKVAYQDGEALLPSYQGLKDNLSGRRREFNQHLTDYLRAQGYRGVIYSPQRYGEYEMRVLDPRDVVQQDIRQVDDPALKRLYKRDPKYLDTKTTKYVNPGTSYDIYDKGLTKKSQSIKDWSRTSDIQANPGEVGGHTPYALGAIYGDIDLSQLRLDPEDVRRAAREQVKMALLAQEEATLADKLSLGHLGEKRVRREEAVRGEKKTATPLAFTL